VPGAHPWPDVPPSSQFGHQPSRPVEYARVEPLLVVELEVDTSFEDYRGHHAARLGAFGPTSPPPTSPPSTGELS
jgi:hypothetical protein